LADIDVNQHADSDPGIGSRGRHRVETDHRIHGDGDAHAPRKRCDALALPWPDDFIGDQDVFADLGGDLSL
jgi:hypothetical protein